MPFQTIHYVGKPEQSDTNRYAEIKFYLYLLEVIKYIQTPKELIEFVNNVAHVRRHEETLDNTVLRFIRKDPELTPTRQETVVLMYKHKVPMRKITQVLHMSQMEVYKILDVYERNPMRYTAKLPAEKLMAVYNFNDNIEQLSYVLSLGGNI